MRRATQRRYRHTFWRHTFWRLVPAGGDEGGFTMIELVMAILIFGLVVSGIGAGMMSTLNLARQNRNRSIAANLASQEMDLVRSTTFTDLPLGQTLSNQSVDGVPYVIDRETEWITQSASSGPCQAPAGSDLAYLAVAVSVTWPNMAGVKPPATNTIINPPVGTFNPLSGHIAVTVKDRTGLPQDGVTVTIVGSTVTDSQTTGVDGCAFFAYEPAGAYTVSLSGAGYVSDQEDPAPTQSATVTVGGIVPVQFQYDVAATVMLTLQGNTGGAVPAGPPGIPIGLWNTHILPSGIKIFPGNGNPRTVGGLFPFTDGYEVWAGGCLDANPEGTDSSGALIYPGASRQGLANITPGGSTSATLSLPEVLVTAKTAGGVLRNNVTVIATHVPTPPIETGCPGGEVYTLGTTNALGQLLAALPYGTWAIKAGATAGGNVSLSPLDPPTPVGKIVIVP